jgi:hypothetical protein
MGTDQVAAIVDPHTEDNDGKHLGRYVEGMASQPQCSQREDQSAAGIRIKSTGAASADIILKKGAKASGAKLSLDAASMAARVVSTRSGVQKRFQSAKFRYVKTNRLHIVAHRISKAASRWAPMISSRCRW